MLRLRENLTVHLGEVRPGADTLDYPVFIAELSTLDPNMPSGRGEPTQSNQNPFMLGENILFAPVLERGARSRTVIFPPGEWRACTGRIIHGPVSENISTPLSELAYFHLVR